MIFFVANLHLPNWSLCKSSPFFVCLLHLSLLSQFVALSLGLEITSIRIKLSQISSKISSVYLPCCFKISKTIALNTRNLQKFPKDFAVSKEEKNRQNYPEKCEKSKSQVIRHRPCSVCWLTGWCGDETQPNTNT